METIVTNRQQSHPTEIRELLPETSSILCRAQKVKQKNVSYLKIIFYFVFCDAILNIISLHMNSEIVRKRQNWTGDNVSPTTKEELQALFVILLVSAAKIDNPLSAGHMFDATIWFLL